jgi:hypothetical protein
MPGVLGQPPSPTSPPASVPAVDLLGAWRQVDGDALLLFRGDQLFTYDKGALTIVGVVHLRPQEIVVRHEGVLETWQASLHDGTLKLGKGDNPKPYRRLPHQVPAEVDLHPLMLPAPHPLAPERVQAIQREVEAAYAHDQGILKDKSKSDMVKPMLDEDLHLITRLVQEVGWLDTARFGSVTSSHATILLKHTEDMSGSLPLELAVLPDVERDLKLSGDGQTFAVLYDSVQLQLGKKQKYGTQIVPDSKGNLYVLPLENPAKVDDYLKEMGVPSFASYLEAVKHYTGKPVRLATPEESE